MTLILFLIRCLAWYLGARALFQNLGWLLLRRWDRILYTFFIACVSLTQGDLYDHYGLRPHLLVFGGALCSIPVHLLGALGTTACMDWMVDVFFDVPWVFRVGLAWWIGDALVPCVMANYAAERPRLRLWCSQSSDTLRNARRMGDRYGDHVTEIETAGGWALTGSLLVAHTTPFPCRATVVFLFRMMGGRLLLPVSNSESLLHAVGAFFSALTGDARVVVVVFMNGPGPMSVHDLIRTEGKMTGLIPVCLSPSENDFPSDVQSLLDES